MLNSIVHYHLYNLDLVWFSMICLQLYINKLGVNIRTHLYDFLYIKVFLCLRNISFQMSYI